MRPNVALGGPLSAIGIIVTAAISGGFVNWASSLLWFAQVAFIGRVGLPIARFIVDKLVISGQDLNHGIVVDRSVAAGVREMSVAVSCALVIAAPL